MQYSLRDERVGGVAVRQQGHLGRARRHPGARDLQAGRRWHFLLRRYG